MYTYDPTLHAILDADGDPWVLLPNDCPAEWAEQMAQVLSDEVQHSIAEEIASAEQTSRFTLTFPESELSDN